MELSACSDRTGRVLVVMVWVVLLVSCGGGGGDSSSDASQTGSLSFTLEFAAPNGPATREFAENVDICDEYLIEEIRASLYQMDGSVVASGSWPCSDHGGVLDNVEPASDLVVVVTGIVGGEALWKGQKAGIEVVVGEVTPAGMIIVVSIENDTVKPQILSKAPDDGANGITVETTIFVDFSEPVSVISLYNAFSITDNESSTIEGTISYFADYDEGVWRATYTPTGNLRPGVEYTVTLLSVVQDLADNAMDEETWSFTTSTDTFPGLIWGQHNWGEANWQ